jgi:hypothetical protein
MDRRAFLKSAAGAGAAIATNEISGPAISQRAAARPLPFVSTADLANFDPIWNSMTVVRDAVAMRGVFKDDGSVTRRGRTPYG